MKKRGPHKDQGKIVDFLRSVGMSENESAVYLSALKLGSALVKNIAKHAQLNRTTTYNLLLDLRKQGLVSSYEKRGLIHFSAVSPERLNDLLNHRIEETEKLKRALEVLRPELRALFHSQAHGSNVKIFEGLDSLPGIYWGLYGDARVNDEGIEFTNWGGKFYLFPQKLRADIVVHLKKKGTIVRSLLVEDELTTSWVKRGTVQEMRKNIRLLPNPGWDFFCNLEVVNHKIAIVTYRDDVNFQGLLIESRELASMFKFMFESLWEKAGR